MLSKFACGRGYQKSEVWRKWKFEWVSGKAKVESQVNRVKHRCWRTASEDRPYNGYSKSEEDDPHAKAAWGHPEEQKIPDP